MTNFVRLVQFAWRYRVRFGLSIGCAAMVALLFFTELGAVYPLLHILFDSQNPKRWVAEKSAPSKTRSSSSTRARPKPIASLKLTERGERVLRGAQRCDYERLHEDHKAERALTLDAREHALWA